MISDKKELRAYILAKRASLGEKARREKSLVIQNIVMNMEEFSLAQTIMLFMNFRDEVETDRLANYVLNSEKRLILPRCGVNGELTLHHVRNLEEDIEIGKWGIREPKIDCPAVHPEEIDLVIVPGVAFDKEGNRLGYGGGYYDRFMPKLKNNVPRIGIAFQCQVVDHLSTEPFDQTVTRLVTENGIVFDKNEEDCENRG